MLLIDANLTGGSSVPAIVNNGTMYARNISQSGYSMIIENKKGTGVNATGSSLGEFTSHTPRMVMPSTPTSLNLPIKELPEVAWGDPNSSDWGNVADYLLPEDGTDITNALQAAIDAGHKNCLYTLYSKRQ